MTDKGLIDFFLFKKEKSVVLDCFTWHFTIIIQ